MHEFDCSGPIHVQVRVPAGSLEIVAEERRTATVDVAPYDTSDGAREMAAQTRVDMRDGRLVIEAPEASGWLFRRGHRLRVDVRVPLDSTLQIRVASADASCHGRYATASINSASGDVYIENVTGDFSANTASGDVRIGDIGGQVKVNAASGDVSAQSVGGEVTAHSASGDIDVEQAGAGFRATTASGDIRVGSAHKGAIRVNTASGNVSVGVVAGTGVWLDLTTMSGATRSDLAVSESSSSGGQDLTIQVRTASGDIEIHRVNQPAAA